VKLETLRGGDLRLSDDACIFLYRRLRPGVLLTLVRGRDTDQFGTTPLDIIDRECRLFQRPVEWFLDASQVKRASITVSDKWTAWLREHPGALAKMHVLTNSKETRLMVEIARHFSDSSDRLTLYADREAWASQRQDSAAWLIGARELEDRWEDSPIAIQKEQSQQYGLTLSTHGSSWSFRRIGNGLVYSKFSGSDTGELTDAALDEMERVLSLSAGKVSWFLDLREAHSVAARVSQVWTEWLSSRRDQLFRVSALAPSPLFPLVFTIASFSAGIERLVRIHREVAPFQEELKIAGCVGMPHDATGFIRKTIAK